MNIALLYGTSHPPDEALKALAQDLESKGATVTLALWSDPAMEWKAFDAIIIRSTWDYYRRLPDYRAWLMRAKAEKWPLYNDPDLVLWNLDKQYLLELEEKGVPILSTRMIHKGDDAPAFLAETLSVWSDKNAFIVKPSISAGAYRTVRLNRAEMAEKGEGILADILEHSSVIVQPYRDEIQKGEISLIFLNGDLSYAVRKQPTHGDFRVQKKYGGQLTVMEATPDLITAGQKVLACLDTPPLYARVDGLLCAEGFLLMELEINEPSLYEEIHPAATNLVADAIICRIKTA